MATERVSETPGANRRLYPRFEVMEYACLRGRADGREENCVIVDVSLGGLQARCKQSFPVGSTYFVEIAGAHASPLVIQAEVKYCVPLEGTDLIATGLRVSSNDRHALRQWVDFVRAIFGTQAESLDD